ncbi:MAG TPA: hypothetical protein DCO79_16780 [Spirochaeta sp.]|nr:hypothetical protein [Spirochaeta sp.]
MLGRASDYRDSETGEHIKRVSQYSVVIAEGLKMNDAFQELLFQSSPLHDIGKLAIPDSILLKPGRLTSAEFEKIKEHASIGYEFLNDSSSQYLKAGAIIAYSHHERWDGKGYPRGLKQENIPIFGRIVSVVDVFDALTSERPYKNAISFEDSVDIIQADSGIRFDPSVIKAFMANLDKIKLILEGYR